MTNSGRGITKEEYEGYLRYVRSLLFYNRGEAEDILHNVLVKAVKEDVPPPIIMYRLRLNVLDRNKKKRDVYMDSPPIQAEQPSVIDKLKLEDVLTALRYVQYNRQGTQEIDPHKTATAHKIVLMSARGYSNKEIGDELGMNQTSVRDLKHTTVKRLKALL